MQAHLIGEIISRPTTTASDRLRDQIQTETLDWRKGIPGAPAYHRAGGRGRDRNQPDDALKNDEPPRCEPDGGEPRQAVRILRLRAF